MKIVTYNDSVGLVVDYPSGLKWLVATNEGSVNVPAVLRQLSHRSQAWSYDPALRCLSSNDGRYLDLYQDRPGMVHLWTRRTGGLRQEFHVDEHGQIFTPHAASEPLRCRRYIQGGGWQIGFHLGKQHPVVRMEKGLLTYPAEFEARGTLFRRIDPTDTVRHTWCCPAYIGTGGHFVEGVAPAVVLLIEQKNDFAFLVADPATTHPGAFGSDTERVDDPAALPHALRSHQWSVVWKWPADLFNQSVTGLSGDSVTGIPLPVGTYPLLIDGWTPLPVSENAAVPIGAPVTKWRVRAPCGAQVHYLAYGENRVAMVTSRYFFLDLLSASEAERTRVHDFLRQIRDQVGIQGISCHGQHHAIVFYHTSDQTLIRPSLFGHMLKTNQRGLLSLLVKHGLEKWAEQYISMFGTSAKALP
jgi:hypothetical protein